MIRRPNLSDAVMIFMLTTPQNATPWQHEQRTLRLSWCKVLGPMHQRKRYRQGLRHWSEVDRFDESFEPMFSHVFSLILALCPRSCKESIHASHPKMALQAMIDQGKPYVYRFRVPFDRPSKKAHIIPQHCSVDDYF